MLIGRHVTGSGAWHTLAWIAVLLGSFSAAVHDARAQNINYNLATTSVLQVRLPQSQAVTVTMSEPIGKIFVGNQDIADAQPITDQSVYLVGKTLGRTTVNLFSTTGQPVGLIAVEVSVDTADIARAIHSVVPSASVQVGTVNGRVRLSGSVPDAPTMQKVLAVASQYGSDQVINNIGLSGAQQVNLQVRILEAQRSAGRELGINWRYGVPSVDPGTGVVNGTYGAPGGSGAGAIGSNTFQNGGIGNFTSGAPGSNVAGSGPTFATFIANVISNAATGFNLDVVINALESKNLVRTLAEPNLTTLSGQNASFLAGGQVPVRTPDSNGNATLVYKDFGVKLVFTPVVLNDGRIQIRLAPEVSEISGFTAANDPVFNTRTLDSTVELRDGQSFSIAGLLQSNNQKVQKQLPWVGDIPILGALFRSSSYQKNETELVVIVTPRLVQPNTPSQVASTPLDKTQPANDPQFFLLGQLEVTPKMIKKFENGEGVTGPYGFIIKLDDR
jgi:pilus assembly protein CpaC